MENILWKELGTKDDYNKYTKGLVCHGNVAAFIRSITYIDRNKALEKFSKFLSDNKLNSQQQEYLKTIINYVCENGDITNDILVNESPFDNFNWDMVFGNYVSVIPQYVNLLHSAIMA